MKVLGWTAAMGLLLVGWTGSAAADPWKDESGHGHGRWRGGYERPRGERRAFKQEYDDGRCKYERKLEKSGEYKEEVKCRDGYRSSYRY